MNNSRTEVRIFTLDFLWACMANLAAFGSFYLLLATLPTFVLTIGGRESDVGVILGTFAITAVVLRPVIGAMADRRGKKGLVLAGAVVLAISSFLYSMTNSLPLLLALRILHGIGWAAFGTAMSALVADIVPAMRRGEAMGYFGMSTNVAMAIGPAIGVFVAMSYGYQVLFVVSALVALIAVATSIIIKDDRQVQAKPEGGPAWQMFLLPSAFFPSLVLALSALTYASIVTFLPVYAEKHSIGNPGLFFTVFAVVVIVGRGPLGRLSDRLGRGVVIAPGLLVAGVGLAVLSWSFSMATMLMVAVLYGLAMAAIQPTLMALAVDRAGPAQRGAAMGTFSTAMDLGIGLGSFGWGVVVQAGGFGTMYLAAAAVSLVALLVLVLGGGLRREASVMPVSPPST